MKSMSMRIAQRNVDISYTELVDGDPETGFVKLQAKRTDEYNPAISIMIHVENIPTATLDIQTPVEYVWNAFAFRLESGRWENGVPMGIKAFYFTLTGQK